MALIVEDGTGRADAESPLSVTDLDAMALRENWTAWPASGQQVPKKEAAARQGTRWAESRFRARLLGVRLNGHYRTALLKSTQRLLFPMSGFVYPDGRTLSSGIWLPPEWALIVGLAALRAFAGTLSPDLERGGWVEEETVDVITTVYADGAPAETLFPEIEDAGRPLWMASGAVHAVRC